MAAKMLIFVAVATGKTLAAGAQQITVTLPVRELSVWEAFEIIEGQTSYKFMINQSSLDRDMTVNVTNPQMTVSDLLDKLFAGTGFSYAIDGKFIVAPVEAAAGQQREEIAVRPIGPKGHVLGIVTDSSTKKGVAGVQVVLVGTDRRAVTDTIGRFELRELRPDNYAVELHIPQIDTVIHRELIVREGMTTQQDLMVPLPQNASLAARVTIIPAGRKKLAEDVQSPPKYTYILAESAHGAKTYYPKAALKVDVPYLATLSPNMSLELGLGRRWTIDIATGVSTGKIGGDGVGLRHALVRPELRYWFDSAFERHFIGMHAICAKYHIADQGRRYEGWGAGIGLVYGYHLPIAARWACEFSVGAGYARLDYKDFKNDTNDVYKWNENKHYFGPTKVAASLVFMIN